MKRQDAVSSSRREGSPENRHTKSIGCMSGIFQLVYKSNHRRRFLTFGKRQEKNTVLSSPKKQVNNSVTNIQAENPKEENKITTIQRFSCDVPRSPTLSAEIRRSNSVNSPENFRAPPALVARLMGLEEGPVMTPESAVEKRRKLLAALDRCDDDLKALKTIIEVVKNSVSAVDGGGDSGDEKIKRCSSSPVVVSHHRHVVLDELARCGVSGGGDAKRHANARVMTQQQQQRQQHHHQRKVIKPVEEGITNINSIDKLMSTEWIEAKASNIIRSSDDDYYEMWNDKVMIETVNEVCRDIDWGEKREIGRIGLALQDRIWRDLVDEIVRDMKCFVEVHCCSLPLEACRKRLRF